MASQDLPSLDDPPLTRAEVWLHVMVMLIMVAGCTGAIRAMTDGRDDLWVVTTAVLVATLGVGYAWFYRAETRRRRRALAAYGTLEGALARLDLAEVRTIRDRDGQIHAVRHVRDRLPELKMQHIVDVVRRL